MINDLLVMSRNQQKNALVSETIKANQLWSEVLDNAAFEAEQMGKSLTVNFPHGPWPLYGNRTPRKVRWKTLFVMLCVIPIRRLKWALR